MATEIIDLNKKREMPDHFAEVFEKNGDIILQLPESLIKRNGWKPGDLLEWSDTEVCTDEGEYDSVCLLNISLERRMSE